MNKADAERKRQVIRMMSATAGRNGKNDNWYHIEAVANRLHRLEVRLGHLAEDECNYPEYDEAKQERLEKLAEKIIAEEIGCKCYTQRDPRGYAIRMYLTDETGAKWYNSWDGETTGLNW